MLKKLRNYKNEAKFEFNRFLNKITSLRDIFMLSLGIGVKTGYYRLMDYIDEKQTQKLPVCENCKLVLIKCKCEHNKLEK